MSGPMPLEDQAESIAERRQHVAHRRMLAAVVSFLALIMVGSLWLGAVLGLAVRLFKFAAGWG